MDDPSISWGIQADELARSSHLSLRYVIAMNRLGSYCFLGKQRVRFQISMR